MIKIDRFRAWQNRAKCFCRFRTAAVLAVCGALLTPPVWAEEATAQDDTYVYGGDARLARIAKLVAESEYEIRWQEGVAAYQSPNRAQNLRFTYLDNGFVAQRRAPLDAAADWVIEAGTGSVWEAPSLPHPGKGSA